jgi:murein DD-endopeptidase MepM/ murein hydrolase activator NlpD
VSRRSPVRLALVLTALGLGATVGGIAGAAPKEQQTTATAVAVRIVVPGVPDVKGGEVVGPPGASTDVAGFAYPDDASIVRLGDASGTVAAQPGDPASAQATAGAAAVSLFGGEITADTITARATTAAGAVAASTDTSASHVDGLVVLGQPVTSTPNAQLPLADWGTIELLVSKTTEGPATPPAAAQAKPKAARATVIGVRIKILADHGGLPAGSEIDLGSAEATAVASQVSDTPPATTSTGPARPVRPPKSHLVEPGTSIPGAPADLVRPLPAGVQAKLTSGGYVFPVYGPASFGDTFGASRPDVKGGWHHGEDIFAPLGAPLLAVANGTVHTVGWNAIGGWRFWLRDDLGNEFYYAHLSAYSPLAAEGQRVRAGDVIGFMGKSGDAEFSPPHLHFEIHPAALQALGYDGVVAPYPFLVAWRHAQDASFAEGRTYASDANGLPRAVAPPPGAVLLQSSDISGSSGLVPGALGRAFGKKLADVSTGELAPIR